MDATRLLADLDPEQRRAVTTTAQPLCILAGAGSGKTRVLTRRIAYRTLLPPDEGGADPRHVLALTFTRKAASEMGTRLARLGLRDRPQVGTLHAVAWAQVRRWLHDRGRPVPDLLQAKARIVRELPSRGSVPVPEVIAEIEWARARDLDPAAYPRAAHQEDRRPSTSFDHVAALMVEYAEAKRRRGVMDFDDMLARAADLFDEEPDFARVQRWRFRHLFVDEFQDLNPLQYRLLRGWLGDRTDLCVVGDPRQAIYRWNGADAGYLTGFTRLHPGAEVVELRRNHRSTPEVLHLATAVLGPGAAAPLARRSTGEPPVLSAYGDEHEEARGIARAARVLHRPGGRWDEQAVLVRTNAQLVPIEAAFTRARIPFRVRLAEAATNRAEVAAALRHVAPGRDHPVQVAVVDLEEHVAAERERRRAAGEVVEALDALLRRAREFAAMEPEATIGDLEAWLAAATATEGEGVTDAVQLATFHAAKGLEWPVVHVAGLEEGFVPIAYARSADAEAEERRLLHVAITRAEKVVRLSWAGSRTIRDAPVARRPSRYVDALVRAAADIEAVARVDPEGGLAQARTALAGPAGHDLDRELLAALREWRAEVARRADTAPAVVMSDRALGAVARARPADLDALAALDDLGPLTVAEHGAALLTVVSRHMAPARTP